jgi:diguanylate cyclase (GGDEF)-like protein
MYYGLFLLFNERTKVQQGLFYFVCLVVVSMSLLLDNSVIGNIESLLFIAFAWYYFADDIPFGSKPKWILAIFAIAKVLFFIDILTEGNTQILQFASSVLYVSSYILLLSMNVDHLMSIVQGTYQSSISDALTGLYNRRYFTRCVQQCVMKKISASTIFLDIDNFKKLNDTYGHAKGDETLKNVARILMEETEGIGVVGRYGGEEITCLIVDPTIEMDELTEMIRARIEAEASFDTSSGVCTVTASIGYSAYEEGWSVDQFIKAADKAMYASKLTGKNKVIEYGSVVYLAYKGKNSDTEMREVEGQ